MAPTAAKTILIVDDDADIRSTLREILEDESYTVMDAGNGQLALECLQQVEALPELILLDLGMPVMNGAQFRAAQREIPRIADIPVVVITAAGDSLEKARALQPKSILAKPFRIEALLALLPS
jgi:CheY-like chemotaxis protein